jgi:hypothetical protein
MSADIADYLPASIGLSIPRKPKNISHVVFSGSLPNDPASSDKDPLREHTSTERRV